MSLPTLTFVKHLSEGAALLTGNASDAEEELAAVQGVSVLGEGPGGGVQGTSELLSLINGDSLEAALGDLGDPEAAVRLSAVGEARGTLVSEHNISVSISRDCLTPHLLALPSWHLQNTPQSSGSSKVPHSRGQLVLEMAGSSWVLAPHSTRCSSSHCSTLYSSLSSSMKARPLPQVLSSARPSTQAQYLSQLKEHTSWVTGAMSHVSTCKREGSIPRVHPGTGSHPQGSWRSQTRTEPSPPPGPRPPVVS